MLFKMEKKEMLFRFSVALFYLSATHRTWPTHSEGLRLWAFLFNVLTQKCHTNVAYGEKSVFFFTLNQLNSPTPTEHFFILGGLACHFG